MNAQTWTPEIATTDPLATAHPLLEAETNRTEGVRDSSAQTICGTDNKD